jgi:hypothetical protein
MNHIFCSRLIPSGITAMSFFALALLIVPGAKLAHASTLNAKPLVHEPATNQAPAFRKGANTIQLDETRVSGNQELPKVLYILPWQQPDGIPEIVLESEAPELEVFRRLYPPAYRRELNYYEQLQAAGTEK